MSTITDHSDEDDDYSCFYSDAAKRYKKERQAVCPTGELRLVNQKDKTSSYARNVPHTPAQQLDDSSDEELFRDPNRDIQQEVDLDETVTNTRTHKQVETLEDIEEYINISPEESFSEGRKVHSSASIQSVVDEYEEEQEDPLFCAPLNDSELNLHLDDDEKVEVKVRFIAQKVWRIEIKRADYFKTICQKLSENTDVDAGKIHLYFKDQLLNDYDSLKTVPLRISDIIDASVCNDGIIVNCNENILELKVQSQHRNAQVVVSMRPEDPMAVLMQKYADSTGIDLSKLKFKFDGEMLEEDDTPASLELEGGECIDVFIRE